ncbi:hypothetical protein [Amycolatopsis jiangsuensis]|uniref:PE family protein n=1 Tax=Amycolatopsis jiangsuensis TaxID=1181879 RepID=A0A840J228_9PSEU|nr:hypothetical protein [Amycolatopsis jiangsuensis]MBB4687294.1 hypothetical protein [Amycolatopsis jiangsuensis]
MAEPQPAPDPLKDTVVPEVPPIMVGGYGSSGGYKFSEDEVDAVIKQWEDLLTDLTKDRVHAQNIADVKPPADEVASHTFINQGANPSGKSLLDEHNKMVKYTQNFITALTAAKNKITVNEQENRDRLAQQDKGGF